MSANSRFQLCPGRILRVIILALSANGYAVSSELTDLRIQTKRTVESRHCYNCHSPGGSRPVAGALKVYNLSREAWFSDMSDRQLKEFKRRMLTYLTPDELKEAGGNPNEKPLQDSQEKIISRWVDAELASRHPGSLQQMLK